MSQEKEDFEIYEVWIERPRNEAVDLQHVSVYCKTNTAMRSKSKVMAVTLLTDTKEQRKQTIWQEPEKHETCSRDYERNHKHHVIRHEQQIT